MNSQSIKILFGMIVILLLSGLVTVYVVQKAENTEIDPSERRKDFQTVEGDIVLKSLSGDTVQIESYDEDILIVVLWASWCPTCIDALNQLSQLGNDYANNEVSVLAINRSEDAALAQRYIEKMNIDTSGFVPLLDFNDSYFKNIDGFTMPEIIMYDKDGAIIEHQKGNYNHPRLLQQLEATLLGVM